MEEKHGKRTDQTLLWGVLLIGLGVLFLLRRLIPGVIGGILWSGAFAVGGLAVYSYYRKNPTQWWAQIPAYGMWVLAAIIALGTSPWVPGELIGAFIMFAIGFPFFYVYLKNNDNWWALIPAYVMSAIGVLILLSTFLSDELIGAYVMFAIAAPFLYVYLNDRNQWWALIPGGITSVIGVGLFVSGIAFLIPVAMIVVGVYLLVRQASGKRQTAQPAQPQPTSGPAADHPVTEFEPIGTPTSGPEADHV